MVENPDCAALSRVGRIGRQPSARIRIFWRFSTLALLSLHHRAFGSCKSGVGTALIKALFPRAVTLGKHMMIGGIDADNAASIHLHRKLGFETVAHLREVGRKFDRWLDLVFLQRTLSETDLDTANS
jgi:Acetyltransferase (GNAT) family